MNNIVPAIEQIEKELKVDSNGVGYATIRGAARLCDVSQPTLTRHFKGDSKKASKLTQMLTQQGFSPIAFSKDGIPDIALGMIIKYYAYFAGSRKTEQAQKLDLALGAIGLRVWIQNTLGWKPKKKEVMTLPSVEMRRLRVVKGLIELKKENWRDGMLVNTCNDLIDFTNGTANFPQIPVEASEELLEAVKLAPYTSTTYYDINTCLKRVLGLPD